MLPFLLAAFSFQAPTLSPSAVDAKAPAAAPSYTRFVTKTDGTVEMSTAAQRLVAPGKPIIWLVGAIHIGRKDYYTGLQKLLDAQDTVFFEGVRPAPASGPATAAPAPALVAKPAATPGAKPTYRILSDAIGLDFQLADIDYKHSNWKNVDLTWADLDALNKTQANGKPSQYDQIKGFLDPNGPMAKTLSGVMDMATPGMKEAIKIVMIKAAGSDNTPGLDPSTEKIILEARNKAVADALGEAMSSPTPPHSIAVFYGAKHMAELQAALTQTYGYRLDEKRWYPAASADPKKLDPMGKMMLDSMEKMLAAKSLPPLGTPPTPPKP